MSDEMDAARGPGEHDAEEEALMSELRALATRQDPVPPEAIAAARSAIAWRTLDAELAALTDDFSVEPASIGVRGTGTPTLLTFESPDLTVEIEILATASGQRLLGQLVPPTTGEVEVRHTAGTTRVRADEIGRFRADDVAAGPVSLRCTTASGVVQTDWFLA